MSDLRQRSAIEVLEDHLNISQQWTEAENLQR